MKMYYTEDRTAGQTGADASPRVQNALDLSMLTDWSAEDFDAIMDLACGHELETEGHIYIKRLV